MIGELVFPEILFKLDCLEEFAFELAKTDQFAFLVSVLALLLLRQELELVLRQN